VPGGLTAGLIAPVPDHRQQPGDRVRARNASAEHIAVDVRRDDQASRPASNRPAGASPQPPMPARAQRTEEERTPPRTTPVNLAVIPRPGLTIPPPAPPTNRAGSGQAGPAPPPRGRQVPHLSPAAARQERSYLDVTRHIGHAPGLPPTVAANTTPGSGHRTADAASLRLRRSPPQPRVCSPRSNANSARRQSPLLLLAGS
jgi:hypothetical protein